MPQRSHGGIGSVESDSLRLTYYKFPPSENSIRQIRWIRVKGGQAKARGITYTPEAEGYKREFREHVRQEFFVDVQKFRRAHKTGDVYLLRLFFYFPHSKLINATFSQKGGAKTPYKKMDVGNRRKLLEDSISEAIDLDDSLFFGVEMYKILSEDDPRIEIIVDRESPSAFGI